MILDYNAGRGTYFLRVPRLGADIQVLMQEHGLDFSATASTPGEAVLLTKEPYAAVSFAQYATPRALDPLGAILAEIEASRADHSGAHIKCPADKELWAFQKANVEYALRRRNTLVGDQPGLGKTEVAICFANEINAKRVLVICPANIRLQWARRIREWSTMQWPFTVYPILKGRNGVHPTSAWTIVSYDLARTPAIAKGLAERTYDLVILDEAHYLKESDSGRTKAVLGETGLAGRAGSIMALTGTPLPNRPREAYTLSRRLCFDAVDWMSENRFRRRFNPSMKRSGERADGSEYVYVEEHVGRYFELQNRLRANFMCRHMKRDVMTQLKMPVFDLIQVEETGPVKQALKAESLLEIDPENLGGADAEVLGHIAALRRKMGVAMAPQIADYVGMLLQGGEDKLVVFAWHLEVLDILERRLQKWNVLRIDGSTSARQKEARVQKFIEEPERHVIIGNMQSMGVGTDGLQLVAWHGLIAEPDWVPGNNVQAFDRLDRGGQTRTVQGDIFVAPNSIAERVLASALRKMQVTNKTLDARVA